MELLMGIDLGTSSVKSCIADREGNVLSIASQNYDFDVPKLGQAEQSVKVWWDATVTAVKKSLRLLERSQIEQICGIGFSGQMHGMVCLDKERKEIRPAILHCDQRTKETIEEIYQKIPLEEMGKVTFNRLSPGFLLGSLIWVRDHEPDHYERIWKVLLPKDYLCLMMTGEVATEYSDAAGTGAFDVRNRRWATDMIEKLGLRIDIFPRCEASEKVAGLLRKEAAEELGLPAGIKIIHGGGDQPMQALGNGVIRQGMVTSTIGTSGQIYRVENQPVMNPKFNTNTFCNAFVNSWYSMGAIMSAGVALNWFTKKVISVKDFKKLDSEISNIPVGAEGVFFLPYLMGERTPHMNPNAKAMFFGLAIKHDYRHMVRAIMEGVCFALKDCLLTLNENNPIDIKEIIASGGGANSPLWMQMQADIYEKEIKTTKVSENACFGAIILSSIGSGIYGNVEEACEKMIRVDENVIQPKPENIAIYREQYEIYKALYRQNESLF